MQNKILHNLAKVSFKRFGCFQMYTFFFRGMSSSQYLLLLNLILSGKHVFKHFSIRSSTPQLLKLRRHQLGRVHRRRSYRTAPIDGTNLTPFEIIFGRPANLPVDNALAAEEEAAKKEAPLTPQEYSERVAEATRNHAETIRSVQGERRTLATLAEPRASAPGHADGRRASR